MLVSNTGMFSSVIVAISLWLTGLLTPSLADLDRKFMRIPRGILKIEIQPTYCITHKRTEINLECHA